MFLYLKWEWLTTVRSFSVNWENNPPLEIKKKLTGNETKQILKFQKGRKKKRVYKWDLSYIFASSADEKLTTINCLMLWKKIFILLKEKQIMEGKKQKETRLTKKKILPKIFKKGRMYIIEYKDIQSFTCNKYSSNNNETNPQCRRRKGGGGQLFGSKDVNLILSVTYISLITHYF